MGIKILAYLLETGKDVRTVTRPMLGIVPGDFNADQEMRLHVPVTEIQRQTEALRQEYFTSQVSRSKPYQTLSQFRSAEQQFDLEWMMVAADSSLSRSSSTT